MIALVVIMGDEVLNGCPQRLLAEEDPALQAGLLEAAYKSLRVGSDLGIAVASPTPLQHRQSGSETQP